MKFAGYALSALAVVSSALAGLEDVKTTKTLTNANFDSSIAGKHSLVAAYAPWCGHCKNLAPVWEKLGKDFADEDSVLIGQIDADTAENKPIAARYGVKGFPTIKFFPADGSAPVDYSGPRTEDAFIEFINTNAGTHRTAGGLLDSLAGRIPSFDTLFSSFLASSVATRDSVYKQAVESAESLKADVTKSPAAAYYLKVLDKVQTNSEWASSELSRLHKLASKRGTMAGKQLDDLQMRQNILSAYQNAVSGASAFGADASASVESVASQASASVGSAASQVSASASSASSVVSSAINSATGGGAPASASSVSKQGAASASSASGAAASAASSISKQAAASAYSASGAAASGASSASNVAASGASSVYDQAASSASSVGAAGAVYTDSAKSVASDAYASGSSIASEVYASGESAASQASASVDSATSNVAAQATGAASAVKSAAESAYGKVAGEL